MNPWQATVRGVAKGQTYVAAQQATRMVLETVILSEESQTEKEKYPMTSLIYGMQKEMTEMNLQNRKRLIGLQNEFTVARGKR